MSWDSFIWFAAAAVLCWIAGAVAAVVVKSEKKARVIAGLLTGAGSLIFLAFIIGMWISAGRPPMRTKGETRLWFSFFLSVIGISVWGRWGYRWILPFSTVMSTVFVCINLFKPEIHSTVLMPALQSAWFVPHVISYMFAYATMGAVTLLAIYLWWKSYRKPVTAEEMRRCDTLTRIGWGFLTLGITMGALWAKKAWGDFWTWDPKETWAAVTWLSYLLYMHLRKSSLPSRNDSADSADSANPANSADLANPVNPVNPINPADPANSVDPVDPTNSTNPANSADSVDPANPARTKGSLERQEAGRRWLFALLIFSFLLLQMCWWGVNYLSAASGSLHVY